MSTGSSNVTIAVVQYFKELCELILDRRMQLVLTRVSLEKEKVGE
jgi:hypothetical protein